MHIKVYYASALEPSEWSIEDPSSDELLVNALTDFLDLNWVLLSQKPEESDCFNNAVERLVQMKFEHPEMFHHVLEFLRKHQHPDDFTTVMTKLKKKLKSEEPRPYFSSNLLQPIVEIDYRLMDGTQSSTTLTLPSVCK